MYSINTNTATNALMEYARSIAPQGMEAYALAPHESEGESPMIWVAFTRIGEEKGVWDDVLIPYDHLPPGRPGSGRSFAAARGPAGVLQRVRSPAW